MFIVERIISLIIFLLILLIIILLIYKTNDYKKIKRILIIYIILLTIMAYLYIPYKTADIFRLNNILKNYYLNMTEIELISKLKTLYNFSEIIYFYLIAKLPFENMLSSITCFIYYSIMFYIIYDYGKKISLSGKSMSYVLFFFIISGQYMEVISGIRTMIAFSIFVLVLYREIIQQKNILCDLPLYILAIGFHLAVVPAIIIRFIYLLFQKENKFFNKIVNFIIFGMLIICTIYFGQTILNNTMTKAINYLSKNVYSYKWEYLISIFTNLLMIIVYNRIKNNLVMCKIKNYKFIFILYYILDCIFVFEYSIFHRYNRLLVMLFLPILMEYLSINDLNNRKNHFIIYKQDVPLYLLTFIILTLVFVRGDLCSLKFFILK